MKVRAIRGQLTFLPPCWSQIYARFNVSDREPESSRQLRGFGCALLDNKTCEAAQTDRRARTEGGWLARKLSKKRAIDMKVACMRGGSPSEDRPRNLALRLCSCLISLFLQQRSPSLLRAVDN